MHRGEGEDLGQAEGADRLGRLRAWVSLSLKCADYRRECHAGGNVWFG